MHATIGGIAIAALTEVGRYTVKLSPTYRHPVLVRRINRDRAFVSRVTNDVIPIRINVDLVADEAAVRRDHSR